MRRGCESLVQTLGHLDVDPLRTALVIRMSTTVLGVFVTRILKGKLKIVPATGQN